jgi:hypothetical protein
VRAVNSDADKVRKAADTIRASIGKAKESILDAVAACCSLTRTFKIRVRARPMAAKFVEPSVTLKAFSCPRCGALADQTWFAAYAVEFSKDSLPQIWTDAKKKEFFKNVRAEETPPPDDILEQWAEDLNRRISGEVFLGHTKELYKRQEFANLFISKCFSCNQLTVWRNDQILYPPSRYGEEPHPELPQDVKLDFEEARTILELSPRGAAGLLRLCVQKLCVHLGESGGNINADIASLVAKGLPVEVKQALDVVRVIGNEAVHPGQIDLKDDRKTASQLFNIVNFITERMIAQPMKLKALHDGLPADKLEQIEKRDQKALEGK